MRWFRMNGRTYNLDHIKAFEVQEQKDKSALLNAIYSFTPKFKRERLGMFDSVEDAEQWITDILKDALTASSVPSRPLPKRPQVPPRISDGVEMG